MRICPWKRFNDIRYSASTMTIKRTDVERVAALARLELDDDELEALTRDCRSILEYFEAIRDVDVEGATPAGALEHAAPTRDDLVEGDISFGFLKVFEFFKWILHENSMVRSFFISMKTG